MLEFGHSSAYEARSMVAACCLSVQDDEVKRAFENEDDWCVFSKMHDASKVVVTVPEGFITDIGRNQVDVPGFGCCEFLCTRRPHLYSKYGGDSHTFSGHNAV